VNGIESDCAALTDVVHALYESGADIHTMRDITRGGLGTVLNEIAASSGVQIELDEDSIPVTDEVKGFCGVMGLDPLYMGNEGKMIAIIPAKDEDKALKAIRSTKHGASATIIGHITTQTESKHSTETKPSPGVIIKTRIGGTRRIPILQGEGLPRIC
jgi:hydrogenase expression/formation protein HypE